MNIRGVKIKVEKLSTDPGSRRRGPTAMDQPAFALIKEL